MPQARHPAPRRKDAETSEFFDSLKKGLLLGVVLVALIVPSMRMAKAPKAPPQSPVATAPQTRVPQAPADMQAAPPQAPGAVQPPMPGVQLADFRGEDPSPDARLVANWVVHSRNNKQRAFVVVDKKDARVYVFARDGRLKDSAPALLGSAQGDLSYPGIGDKPLKQIHAYEKTTPAGRFVAEMGLNAGNEDVVWVDYDAAVSMHRIRPMNIKERRLERLASLTTDDNRISFGCINLPVTFYENVLSPTVRNEGAVIYVLPEVETPQKVFGAYDVTDPLQQASAQSQSSEKMQRVALRESR